MFRAIGNAIKYVVLAPVRLFNWCADCIGALRRFLDTRRNQLCASIIAIMMAVVGVHMRQSGYADARPGDYAAVTFEELAEPSDNPPPEKRTRATLRQAMENSLAAIKSKLPSFSRAEEPAPVEHIAEAAPVSRTTPVMTVSRQLEQEEEEEPLAAPEIPSLPAPRLPEKQILILPEPTVIDLSDIKEPKPEVASLSGLIETDDDDDDADDGSFFDKD